MTLTEILEATDRLQLSDKLILLERISQLIRQDLDSMLSPMVMPHSLNNLAGKVIAFQGIDPIAWQRHIREEWDEA